MEAVDTVRGKGEGSVWRRQEGTEGRLGGRGECLGEGGTEGGRNYRLGGHTQEPPLHKHHHNKYRHGRLSTAVPLLLRLLWAHPRAAQHAAATGHLRGPAEGAVGAGACTDGRRKLKTHGLALGRQIRGVAGAHKRHPATIGVSQCTLHRNLCRRPGVLVRRARMRHWAHHKSTQGT